ncbi:MAG: haloacid dehalogenase-like hydrolase, partial [Candidatus Korarchaeota archaeon]|nr:haloacid dehalogenase-like hydrolase [Candidatus Korarchaeota archaeon]
MTSSQNIIAVIMDCDDTLCDDTTDFVLESLGISPYEEFWPQVKPKIERGWDPPLAYMDEFIKVSRKRELTVTKETLENLGEKIQFY